MWHGKLAVYDGHVYDTMIAEYLLLRGQKWGVSLADSCARRKVSLKKGDLVEDYISNGIGFDKMPPETVEEYGLADIVSARELFGSQGTVQPRQQRTAAPTFETYEQFLACFSNNRTKWQRLTFLC